MVIFFFVLFLKVGVDILDWDNNFIFAKKVPAQFNVKVIKVRKKYFFKVFVVVDVVFINVKSPVLVKYFCEIFLYSFKFIKVLQVGEILVDFEASEILIFAIQSGQNRYNKS